MAGCYATAARRVHALPIPFVRGTRGFAPFGKAGQDVYQKAGRALEGYRKAIVKE